MAAPFIFSSNLALAQSHAGVAEDALESPRHYSPYIERTAADSNLAEGVYWGCLLYTSDAADE